MPTTKGGITIDQDDPRQNPMQIPPVIRKNQIWIHSQQSISFSVNTANIEIREAPDASNIEAGLIHGDEAQAWAQAGQRALDRKLNENDG